MSTAERRRASKLPRSELDFPQGLEAAASRLEVSGKLIIWPAELSPPWVEIPVLTFHFLYRFRRWGAFIGGLRMVRQLLFNLGA
jgi:hypothetical protein